MGSLSDPGDSGESTQLPASFDDFQRQTSLMTSCTLLWKELSDHFTSLEQDLLKKYEAIQNKIETLDTQTNASLQFLTNRETTIEGSISIALKNVETSFGAAIQTMENDEEVPEVDDSEGLSLRLKSFCARMDSLGFWRFIIVRKKEMEAMREKIPVALGKCVDPARFVLEAISEVFPVDKRAGNGNDLGWACVLMLEGLIPVVVDPILGNCRLLVTPSVKRSAKEIAETWKESLDQRGGIKNVKTPDVHTFLQHLVTFEIVKNEDFDFYRKLVVGSAWRKQMPRLAVSLGLGDKMPDMIEELISKGQQVDDFTHEVGLVDRFPPVPLLKAFLKDVKMVAMSFLEDPNNSGRAVLLAARKEQSALKGVMKCIEEYKLESEFPPENLKKRLEQLEKVKIIDKKRPAAAAVPATKRTRASNVGPMPPAKAGRITNAYISSFPTASAPPSHTQYPSVVPAYPVPSPPPMYGHESRSLPTNPYATYSPEAASLSPPLSYPGSGGAKIRLGWGRINKGVRGQRPRNFFSGRTK